MMGKMDTGITNWKQLGDTGHHQEYSKSTIFYENISGWTKEWPAGTDKAPQVAIRNIPAPPHCVVTALYQSLPIEFQRTPLVLHL